MSEGFGHVRCGQRQALSARRRWSGGDGLRGTGVCRTPKKLPRVVWSVSSTLAWPKPSNLPFGADVPCLHETFNTASVGRGYGVGHGKMITCPV
jgi:hypothetical protein